METHEILPGPDFQGREYRIPGRFDPRVPDPVTYARLALNARLCWIAGRILGGSRGPYESRRTRAGVIGAVEKLQAFRHGFRVRLSGPRAFTIPQLENGVDPATILLAAFFDMFRSRLWGPREIERRRPAF